MKTLSLVVLSVLAFSAAAFAEEVLTPEVKITSFQRIGDWNSNLGEVCGIVKNNDNTSLKLNVIADPKTHSPGPYHVFTGTDGTFCQVINTYSGRVEVSIMGAKIDTAVMGQMGKAR